MIEGCKLLEIECCACNERIGTNGTLINVIVLDKKAGWKYPVAGNVITGEYGRAIAIICDKCVRERKLPKFAIKFNWSGKTTDKCEVVRVPISDLKNVENDVDKAYA